MPDQPAEPTLAERVTNLEHAVTEIRHISQRRAQAPKFMPGDIRGDELRYCIEAIGWTPAALAGKAGVAER